MAREVRPNCLVLDLEVVPSVDGRPERIIKLGALRADSGDSIEKGVGASPLEALVQLDDFGHGASFLLGHNLIEHDLPILRDAAPALALLALPPVDTLRLSPLAFPQNPYHRLVKDYKLIRASLNSPLADCRTTLTLFSDQHAAFEALGASHREELLVYQALLAPKAEPGLGHVFMYLTKSQSKGLEFVGEVLPRLVRETDPSLVRDLKVCAVRMQRLIEHDLADRDLHWPIAYALAWLRVSGGNSVLAPWVRHQFPAVGALIAELRDRPCGDPACSYCRTTHDPRSELKRYFGFDDFRADPDGGTSQHDIVQAAMRGESVLAVMATGGGKSLCYQLPALNRYHRNGSLTIIVSPLQSLMKDQVDGLLERNVQCAAALNGLLTMPERGDVLEKIQLGDVGVLLVSPEQFRNKTFRRAIAHRQIGAWIFDEAHCLSKWGNDFRPDYLYVARFIREFSGEGPVAPIGCFTATAKQDVLDDIRQHFRDELGVEFREFIGKPGRNNLKFEVLPAARGEKWSRTHQLLQDELKDREGGAVVFVASRRNAEELSSFLCNQGWDCRYFHAGLQPHEKKDIQDEFKCNALRVIVATNAFGMGVDKPDVRLVVHADIPGSLENYLQEAGRAGRDQADARCVLLYAPEDIETQFDMTERSRLSQRDIQEILKRLREEAGRRRGHPLVITTGEILLDDSIKTSFDADDRSAETKVVTAIAWLERAQFLRREENATKIFPARLELGLDEAEARLAKAALPAQRTEVFRAILHHLYKAPTDQAVNTDTLMELTSQTGDEVGCALRQMEVLGLLANDTQITLYLRHGTAGSSRDRLTRTQALEQHLFVVLREQAPDADQGAWQDINLPMLTARLRDEGAIDDLLPLHVLRLVRSLAQDRDGESQQRSAFELRQLNRDYLKLRIRGGHSWAKVERLGDSRRALAAVLLPFLIRKIPEGTQARKDLLVETTFGELQRLIDGDITLASSIRPEQRRKAIEHVLLYLHQQEVLTLNHGMTVMRRAMTIEINPEKAKRQYLKEDFGKLDEHYRERRIQVHVMREYAEVALTEMAAALQLVLDYFAWGKQAFLRRYFAGKDKVLALATSESSWRAIVGNLSEVQRAIVTDSGDRNRLILAGPGSGKTRVIVHRIAYLLRVRRVPATAIIALAYNRHAANEIRERLLALVGKESYGLTVLTYHAMAMRLTGTSFARRENVGTSELDALLDRAADLLEGRTQIEGEDDLRERLLSGYRYILVDEYQDIDERQYRLVSALAKRRGEGGEPLCILAVGDDDQNIYAWRGGSTRHIEQYCEEYAAHIDYLVENYRSTAAIIAAANRLIAANPGRLKADHPICIDAARRNNPPAGCWSGLDPVRQGRVMRLRLPHADGGSGNLQAQAVMKELQRVVQLDGTGLQGCAVLSRSHRFLQPLRAFCEANGIAFELGAGQAALSLARSRGFVCAVEHLRKHAGTLDATAARACIATLALDDVGYEFLVTALTQLEGEYGICQLAPATLVDWLYDYAWQIRRRPGRGLYLGTVHSAKGREFDHVALLDGGWDARPEVCEEERRLYYVGMTRARQTLTLCEFGDKHPVLADASGELFEQNFVCTRDPALDALYKDPELNEVDLGFAGRFAADSPVHAAIAALGPGARLRLAWDGERHVLLDAAGRMVGRMSRRFALDMEVTRCEVADVQVRYAEDGGPKYRDSLRCERWEVVVPRLVGTARGRSFL